MGLGNQKAPRPHKKSYIIIMIICLFWPLATPLSDSVPRTFRDLSPYTYTPEVFRVHLHYKHSVLKKSGLL